LSDLALAIGNKNYSSWSLRPWLVLRQSGLDFEETRIPMNTPEFAPAVRAWSPAGRVPVLRHGATYVWDSLAICEYLAETFPEKKLWPREREARALARSISAEMHSSFGSLRAQMPLNVRASGRRVPETPGLAADVARVTALWRDCLERKGARGPFLFGEFSIADAMYAPVVFRFATYGARLGKIEQGYADALRALPAMRAWAEAAARETEVIEADEAGR
jgi:glutathione S-transferase